MAGEERGHGLGDAARVHLLQGVVRAREHERLGLRQPLLHPGLHLGPARPVPGALAAEDAEDGLGDPPGVLPREPPLPQRRQLDAEERVGVGHRLRVRARDQRVEEAAVGWPDRPPQEAVDRPLLVPGSVQLERRPDRLREHRPAGDVQERRLQQDQGVHDLRRVQRQLQGDHPAGGVADDVGALDAQVPQQRPAVGGLLGDAERRRHGRAAGVAAPVVAHQPVAAVSAGSAQSGA